MLMNAAYFAAEKHARQRRKGAAAEFDALQERVAEIQQ
jgi:hypothetical protein